MASVNKVIIVGNLGKDPESRSMPNGEAVTNATVATTESWKDKNSGEKKELTEWHRIVFYRKLAEIASQYLKKGSQVYIEGRLQTRKWSDKDGVERYTTEIIADTMQMLGNRQAASAPSEHEQGTSAAPRQTGRGNAPPADDDYGNRAPQRGAGGGGVAPSARGTRPAPNFADGDDDIPFVKNASYMDSQVIEF